MPTPKQAIHIVQPCPKPLPAPVPTGLDSRYSLLNQSDVATQDETGGHVASATPGGAQESSHGILGFPEAMASTRDPSHGTTIIANGQGVQSYWCRPPSLRTRRGEASVNDIAPIRSSVTAETNPTMVECCGHSSHGDGAFPLRQTDVPTPGRQLPQAKPGWWLGNWRECMRSLSSIQERERLLLCRASSSSHAAERGLVLQERVLRKPGRRKGHTEIETGGRLLAQSPTVSLRVIDSGTSSSPRAGDPGSHGGYDSRKVSLKQRIRTTQRIPPGSHT
jgi:hypothetical protein